MTHILHLYDSQLCRLSGYSTQTDQMLYKINPDPSVGYMLESFSTHCVAWEINDHAVCHSQIVDYTYNAVKGRDEFDAGQDPTLTIDDNLSSVGFLIVNICVVCNPFLSWLTLRVGSQLRAVSFSTYCIRGQVLCQMARAALFLWK